MIYAIRLVVYLLGLLPWPTELPVSVADLRLFHPDPAIVAHNLATARLGRDLLRQRQSIEPSLADWHCLAQDDQATRVFAWEMLDLVRFHTRSEAQRNDAAAELALHRLRYAIGYRAYYGGVMPTPVNVCAFPMAD